MRITFKKALAFGMFLCFCSSKYTSSKTVVSHFKDFTSADQKYVLYENLNTLDPTKLLNHEDEDNTPILIRENSHGSELENSRITYHVHGVTELRITIFHKLGTFATQQADPFVAREYPYILGSNAEPAYNVYYSLTDNTLYLNHRNQTWLECIFDNPTKTFSFRKTDKIFNEQDVGSILTFYGVNVYTSSNNNADFKLVSQCSITKESNPIQIFADINQPDYYKETITFSIPENTDIIKIVFSDIDQCKDNDGGLHKIPTEDMLNSMLIGPIKFEGDNIDFSNYDYQDDVTEMKNQELIKIKESLAQKSTKPKKDKTKHKKSEKPKVEKIVNIEKHIHEYTINQINQAPAPMPDIIMVSPDTSEAIFEEEPTQPQEVAAATQEQGANSQTNQPITHSEEPNSKSQSKPTAQKTKDSAKVKTKKIKEKSTKQKSKNKSKKGSKKRKKEEKENNSSEPTDFQATEFTPKQSKALGYFYICSVIFVLLFSVFHESILKLFSRLSVHKLKLIHKK